MDPKPFGAERLVSVRVIFGVDIAIVSIVVSDENSPTITVGAFDIETNVIAACRGIKLTELEPSTICVKVGNGEIFRWIFHGKVYNKNSDQEVSAREKNHGKGFTTRNREGKPTGPSIVLD